ncbi:MAG: Hachiman antiphage defense system protein HamA [Acidobacteriota bacterium]|jgi:hypothetical protein
MVREPAERKVKAPWTSDHVLKWLVDTGTSLRTRDGRKICCLEFRYQQDERILSAWAKHFRNHYCNDEEIDELREGTGLARQQYLEQHVFPDSACAPGPSIRSGDFAEILVADYLEYLLGYWVPRFRYDCKSVRNESTKGTDILGFRWAGKTESAEDILAMFEAKASLSETGVRTRLQDAVNDSVKDIHVRKAETLNALKRRYIREGNHSRALAIQRFQNVADHPYREISGAVALFTRGAYDSKTVSETETSHHPNAANIILVVITGDDLMRLAHDLYRRAAREA